MKALWTIPLAVVLGLALLPLNEWLYEELVNFDPQGEGQQWEWRYHREVMRNTSGVLAGHLLTFVVGMALARRRVVAVLTGIGIGVAVVGTARLVGGSRARVGGDGLVLWEPAVTLEEPRYWALLLAFPLFALVGAEFGILLAQRRRVVPVAVLAGVGWFFMTLVGLTTGARTGAPEVWFWLLPPLAAARVIAMAVASVSAESVPQTVIGDWGQAAAIALVGGLTGWAVLLGVAVWWRSRSTARRYVGEKS
ncbi:MAG TPA: hypothetical protein VN408_25230 [Actinoplanes sp.]|nr:hypothetical protein [Actinoplanes sp.]